MSSTTLNEPTISIKVMVDREKNRVVYAQADHTFVDILFSFMTLPLGAIVRLLRKQTDKKFEVLASLNNLFQSLVDLPECYFSTEEFKFLLLNPRSPAYDRCGRLKVKIDDIEPKKYFVCENWGYTAEHCVFSIFDKARCVYCGKPMNRELPFKDFSLSANDDCVGGGMFVSDISSYIVTDDLLVMPYTPGCCVQLLIELGVTDTKHLEERTVDFGYEEILDLLRLSMSNISPLTYLVLSKKNMQVKHDEYCTSFRNAESMSMFLPKMFLQVCLQKSTGKLLFAEAEEDFVDFVSGFLSISLGTLINTLMNGSSSLVFMDNIFRSIKSTDLGKYFKSNAMKDILTKPHFGQRYELESQAPKNSIIHQIYLAPSGTQPEKLLDAWILTYRQTKVEMFVRSGKFKRSGMFVVTDDLVITPSLSVSTLDILNKCEVPLNDIERHKVSIDFEEGFGILKASLTSKSALTKGLEHQLKKLNQNF